MDSSNNFGHKSQCLDNLLSAMRTMSAIEAPPGFDGDVLFKQIENLAYLDFTRTNYYPDRAGVISESVFIT